MRVLRSVTRRTRGKPRSSASHARDSVGQTSGATPRGLNPGCSEKIGNSRRTGAACDVVDGRLVEPHPDDGGSIKGGVGLAVATLIQAVPASGAPRGGRDRTRAAELHGVVA